MRTCKQCGDPIPDNRNKRSIYCSYKCKTDRNNRLGIARAKRHYYRKLQSVSALVKNWTIRFCTICGCDIRKQLIFDDRRIEVGHYNRLKSCGKKECKSKVLGGGSYWDEVDEARAVENDEFMIKLNRQIDIDWARRVVDIQFKGWTCAPLKSR